MRKDNSRDQNVKAFCQTIKISLLILMSFFRNNETVRPLSRIQAIRIMDRRFYPKVEIYPERLG